MAEKKVQGKPSFFEKVLTWCKHLPSNIARPFKNMVAELKKVTWPSRQDLTNYSLVVIAFMVLMAVVVGVLDLGASSLMQLLMNKPA